MSNEAAQVNPNNGGGQHSSEWMIVPLGKTGGGKSSLGNTILGEDVFRRSCTANSETRECQRETRSVNGRRVTLIDTPGFFDTNGSQEDLAAAVSRCITESASGIHAFLIVLKVERFTEQEKQVIDRIKESFDEEAFRHAVVVFTHGDQLDEEMTINEYVGQNEMLRDLLQRCRNRCCVIDNKYWRNNQHEYRNNEVQVANLLNTIQDIVEEEGLYTNEMLQLISRVRQEVISRHRRLFPHLSEEENVERATTIVSNLLKKLAGVSTGVLLGGLLGVPVMVTSVVKAVARAGIGAWREAVEASVTPERALIGMSASAAGGGATNEALLTAVAELAEAAAVAAGVAGAGVATAGALVGGFIGSEEAGQAGSVREAVVNTARAIFETAHNVIEEPNRL